MTTSEERLREISQEIDDLFACGKEAEGKKRLAEALEAAKDNDAYRLFFEGEIASYSGDNETAREKDAQAIALKPTDPFLLKNYGVVLANLGHAEDAIALFDQALKIKPDDYHCLRNKGASLSKLGREEEAIVLFDQALKIKPEDYVSLREKGISLANLDREKEAIAIIDQALKIKPDDYQSLRAKGASLSKLGREKEAIAQYNQALKIKPDDYDSLRNKSVSFFNLGKISEAFKLIRLARELNPASEKFQKDAAFVYSKLSEEEKAAFAGEAPQDSTNVGGLRGFIEVVRQEFEPAIAGFQQQKEENEQHLREFIDAESRLDPATSIFLVLRKWNSYTPALPLDGGEKSVGGGYFIYHRGKGTVIDPGYNFIENFHRAGCRLRDIDNIVITHAHNDHTIDFESLLTLLYRNYKEGQGTGKKVNLYLNQGAMLKFASLIDWRARRYLDRITAINPGGIYRLDDNSLVMTVLPAYHDEVVTRYYAVGLHFSFDFGEAGKRSLLLTSDTGLYPPNEKGESGKPSATTEIHELYKEIDEKLVTEVDLLIPHLGSIGKKELSEVEGMDWQPADILYGNHLGVLGVLRLISAIKPKLALVSEFGEELKTFRQDLMSIMRQVLTKVLPETPINILPADLPFIYDLKEGKVFCVDTEEMAPAADIKFEEEDGTFYYFCEQKQRRKFKSLRERFDNTTQRPYLKREPA